MTSKVLLDRQFWHMSVHLSLSSEASKAVETNATVLASGVVLGVHQRAQFQERLSNLGAWSHAPPLICDSPAEGRGAAPRAHQGKEPCPSIEPLTPTHTLIVPEGISLCTLAFNIFPKDRGPKERVVADLLRAGITLRDTRKTQHPNSCIC